METWSQQNFSTGFSGNQYVNVDSQMVILCFPQASSHVIRSVSTQYWLRVISWNITHKALRCIIAGCPCPLKHLTPLHSSLEKQKSLFNPVSTSVFFNFAKVRVLAPATPLP